jgi:hypothetical protein
MARGKKRTPQVEELRPYVEGVAKNLVESASTAPRAPLGEADSARSKLFSSKSVKCSPRRCSTCPSRNRPPLSTSSPPPIGAVLAASKRSLAATRTTRASSRRGRAKPSGTNRKVPARAVGGLFPPQSKSLGLDQGEASAALLEKITYAGVVARSFRRV